MQVFNKIMQCDIKIYSNAVRGMPREDVHCLTTIDINIMDYMADF